MCNAAGPPAVKAINLIISPLTAFLMLRTALSCCLATLMAGALLGCHKDGAPQPDCYSGKVVAYSCMLGPLVDVDPAYPIGARAVSVMGNRFLGNNVVAVANAAGLPHNVQVGQLYFTCTKAAARTGATCLAFDGTTSPVPVLDLHNVSTVSCDSVRAK